jgi:hypothetical protein
MAYKKLIEIRPDTTREFKDESAEYLANDRIPVFNDALIKGGIVTAINVTVSEDGLTKTKTFETESAALFDALRECFFPSNQSYSYTWCNTTGHTIIEEPEYNCDIVGKELEEKFSNFIITYYYH